MTEANARHEHNESRKATAASVDRSHSSTALTVQHKGLTVPQIGCKWQSLP